MRHSINWLPKLGICVLLRSTLFRGMQVTLKTFGKISAGLAFFLCLFGGLMAIYSVVAGDDDNLWIGLGVYFIGKAFFVGPSLLISSGAIK